MNFSHKVSRLLLVSVLSSLFCVAYQSGCPLTGTFRGVDSEFALDSGMMQLEWIGKEDLVVFAVSERGHLYRSGDEGKTWHNETDTKLHGIGELNTDLYGRHGVSRIYSHPGRPNEVLLAGRNGQHWATFDKGASYIQPCGFHRRGDVCMSHPGGDLTSRSTPYFKLHPRKSSYLLAMTRRDACYQGKERDCAEDLWVSSDFGQHWTNLTENSNGRIVGFTDFDWASEEEDSLDILASVYRTRDALDKHTYSSWDKMVDMVLTKDFFKSEVDVLPCGNAFGVVKDKVFAAATVDCDKTTTTYSSPNVQLRVSKDAGRTFSPVCFPVAIEDKDYSIADVTDETAFITVDHDEEDMMESNVPVGNLYASDSAMELFGLSLKRLYRPRSAATDYHRVKAIPATIILNQVDERALGDPEIERRMKDYSDFLQTKVTFSEGATWQHLNAPAVDSLGHVLKCRDDEDGCKLQLHGPSSWYQWGSAGGWFPAYYSHENAPGVIMAVGNVGEFLEHDVENVNTYLSRDGGQSWNEIRKKPHIYEFADHGGIILIAEHATSSATDEFYFSRDEGECWEGPILLREPLSVENIRVEPKAKSHVFIAHGMALVNGEMVTKLITIDIRRILGKNLPDCKEDDYEFWSPTNDHCLLGQNITLERRKRGSRCFNGFDYERREIGAFEPCECTQAQDVQCLYGFARDTGAPSETCDRQLGEDFNASCPLDINDRNWEDNGEAILATDICKHPDRVLGKHHKGKRHGSGSQSGGMSGWLIFLIIILIFAAIGAGLWFARDYLPVEFTEKLEGACQTMSEHFQSMREYIESKMGIDNVSYNRMQEHFQPLNDVADADLETPLTNEDHGGYLPQDPSDDLA